MHIAQWSFMKGSRAYITLLYPVGRFRHTPQDPPANSFIPWAKLTRKLLLKGNTWVTVVKKRYICFRMSTLYGLECLNIYERPTCVRRMSQGMTRTLYKICWLKIQNYLQEHTH